MDLLAYWKYDNSLRDLDEGAGFNFNSNQSRLHTANHIGELLWLFTRVVNTGKSDYSLLARLNVTAKTINAPNYKYGPYRVWGDTVSSRYFKVTEAKAYSDCSWNCYSDPLQVVELSKFYYSILSN